MGRLGNANQRDVAAKRGLKNKQLSLAGEGELLMSTEELDWNEWSMAASHGRLMALLTTLPRERWSERLAHGATLLHYACQGRGNTDAVVALVRAGADVNAAHRQGWRPLHVAAYWGLLVEVRLLCVAGADVRAVTRGGMTVLDFALLRLTPSPYHEDILRFLLVDVGVPLETVSPEYRTHVAPWMQVAVAGRARCRAAVVALLGVKRKHARAMAALDRWVVREVCYCAWATRGHSKWQQPEPSRWGSCVVC